MKLVNITKKDDNIVNTSYTVLQEKKVFVSLVLPIYVTDNEPAPSTQM